MRSDLKKIGEQKSADLVGQTERALYLMDVINAITNRGNNAEVRREYSAVAEPPNLMK